MNLKEIRQKLGLSREELAVKVGVSYWTIVTWERESAVPSRMGNEKLVKFIEANKEKLG